MTLACVEALDGTGPRDNARRWKKGAGLERVAVVGNGIIGHGVAEVFAKAGFPVLLIGRSEGSLSAALKRVEESLALFAREGLMEASSAHAALARIRTTTRLEDAADAGLVIEAVPEDMALKRSIFETLDRVCGPEAILASSSGHPASAFLEGLRHPERVVAAHFWYPPQLLPLVEVCGAPETSPQVVLRTVALLKVAGKEPVVIDREVPGFIGNRIQFAALREAWSLWAAGVASAEAIDAVVRNSIGRRLGVTGPIESADIGGLDTMVRFAQFLQPDLDVSPQPPPALDAMVAEGRRGLPNGRGVYDWTQRDGEALVAARKAELIRWLKADATARSDRGADAAG
jgi:3-hydroxybutyryl-CoA dehydrogenase